MHSVKERAKAKLERDLGSDFLKFLHDPRTVELLLNVDGNIWVERLNESMQCVGSMRTAQAQAVLETVAGFHGKEITKRNPIIEGELPLDGSRFAGALPPIVSAPIFSIRKKAISIFTLEDYVTDGIMTEQQRGVLVDAVEQHKNILIIGGTGSGKTTLVNSVINQIVVNDPNERLIIIEDTGEIQCSAKNYVQYHTTVDVSMTDLLKTTLRMRPDRILVGEVRGPEALNLLMAWNTGHEGGVATIHANNAASGLDRLKLLISMHADAPREIETLIGNVVHIIVHISRDKNGRSVKEIIEVSGYKNGSYQINHL